MINCRIQLKFSFSITLIFILIIKFIYVGDMAAKHGVYVLL